MKTCFSFDLNGGTTGANLNLRTSVFFFGTYRILEEDLYRAVDGHYSWNPSSDEVIFLIPKDQLAAIIKWLSEARVKDRIMLSSTNNKSKPVVLAYDATGSIRKHNFDNGIITPVAPNLVKRIRQQGCQHIFKTHKGLLEASDSHHYVKPSLKHTDKFIRTGSVLVNGVDVEFISVWLLPLLKPDTTCIYTDSSTINSIAFATVNLHNILSEKDAQKSPSIISYESYKGLAQDVIVDKDNSIILISASSGGGMIDKLTKDFGVPPTNICTIFYLGLDLPSAEIICDLTERENNKGGYKSAVVTEVGDRGSFPPHSLAVHIQSEAFVPENPQIKDVNLRIEDIPKWWDDFKKSFIGRSAIACNMPDPADDTMSLPPTKPVVIQADKAFFKNSPFLIKLDQIIINSLPASLTYVIHFEDPSSLALVNRVKKYLREIGKKGGKGNKMPQISYIPAREVTGGIRPMPIIDERSKDSTLIVAGVLSDGTQMLDIAQIARNSQKNHALSFLVGVASCNSSREFKSLRSNLVYSQSGVEFAFHCCLEIYAPTPLRQDRTCWDDEEEFWNRQLTALRNVGSDSLIKIIERRLGVIQSLRRDGLVDNLFLGSDCCQSPQLKLRNNSVYTKGLGQNLPFSQADAFFAIQSTLHDLRIATDRSRRLEQQPHKRCVLSPSLFFRYSDGVIQAAILRAAFHQELDYQMSQVLSARMADALSKILHSPINSRAEGLSEFLYALASRKIRLLKQDLLAVCDVISQGLPENEKSELDKYLCTLIRNIAATRE